MDWIIGGTKDSRNFIEKILKSENFSKDFIVTVVTDYGKKLLEDYGINILVKSMDKNQMEKFIISNSITRVFDFSHPYAINVSENIIEVSKKFNIEYYRFQREDIEKTNIQNNFLYFSNIQEIIDYIKNISENILVTLGSNQIENFSSLPNLKNIYFRILPTKVSVEKLENSNIMAKNIIALQGPFSKEFNKAIFKNYNIKYLITKESGNIGGELEKLESAIEENIKVLILKRPLLNYPWITSDMSQIIKVYQERKNMKKNFVIGTRGSILALAQTEIVKNILENKYPNYTFEIKKIVTTGDKDLTTNWGSGGTSIKSFFTKEIEKELLENTIDFAVHSMKDMPSENPKGLVFSGVPQREDNRDVFISKSGLKLSELPKNPIIGTSSLRRGECIKVLRPDAIIKPLRGNIHTRLRKLEEENYDGIVLAGAGLIRTGLENRITEFFNIEDVIPAPAQGALCIQYKEENTEVKEILDSISCKTTTEIIKLERQFSKIFDGGCHTPIGCSIKLITDNDCEKFIEVIGMYCFNNKVLKKKIRGPLRCGDILINNLAESLKGDIDE
ncbi:hydroxymethylbilane synthase [Fusobacterium perfoetens]|uniref:hydroxymethylbilane synthase n=1 Tax=Fusobacterium perfoetens TaxID=852 RepID=UPI000A5CC225